MNSEFLKGIQARERVVTLKKIHIADSIQLHIYKDSLVPFYKNALTLAAEDVNALNTLLIESEQKRKFFQYSSISLAILTVLLIIF